MAIIKITEKEKVNSLTDEASMLVTMKVGGVESLRRMSFLDALSQGLGLKNVDGLLCAVIEED